MKKYIITIIETLCRDLLMRASLTILKCDGYGNNNIY